MSGTSPIRLLTIAGSDSGGGAGIQADLKTFQALGCYGMSVITALTAQNTVTVKSAFPATASFVAEQCEAVLEDIGADAIKIGMLHSTAIIEAVASCLRKFKVEKIVVDPVMVAKGGSRLLAVEAIDALKELLFPIASIVTPNVPEAELLTGTKIADRTQMEAAMEILLRNVKRMVLKGGHLSDSKMSSDLFATEEGEMVWFDYPRVVTSNTHGTGCTLSAAIAAYAARGLDWKDSVKSARDYLQTAISEGAGIRLGHGCGPVDHAWNIRR